MKNCLVFSDLIVALRFKRPAEIEEILIREWECSCHTMEGRRRMSFEEAQTIVKKISYEAHKEKVYTSAFFVTLLVEQVGQIAEKYLHEGRYGEDIEVDITDVILVCLAYLNWLEKDASASFEISLEKHRRAIEIFKKQPKT